MDKKQYQQTVSVIVPVYNGEAYLKKCLNSICKQSFRDLEIIVVDDGSKDGSAQIVQKIAAEDPRVRLCRHEQNMGLFQARITGVEASHGEYIGFVDADDEISIDWFRLLYQTATEQGNDITAGLFFEKYPDGRWEYLNLNPLRQEVCLEGDAVFQTYITQEGSCTHWQTVCNKLYSRKIWTEILSDVKEFSKNNPRFVMCEDMAFSTALWLRAKRMGNFTQGAVYFYNHHIGASTAKTKDRDSILKKIRDIASAFGFMKAQMKKCGVFEPYKDHFENWVLFYARLYYRILGESGKRDRSVDCDFICETFATVDREVLKKEAPAQEYYYSICSQVDQNAFLLLEEAKEKICSEQIKVVSFDIFDTLIVRPFWIPSDLFFLLNDEFHDLCKLNSYVAFSDIRINSEHECHARIKQKNVSYEDVTLDEIYEQIALDYGVDRAILETVKAKEKELEIRFCVARKMGKQLFDLAKQQNKKVILCSDMYLPSETVNKLLQKNGYQCDKLYLSSELRVAKWTKNLFRYVQRDLELPAKSFIHIGDNYDSDVANPLSLGWETLHLTKPVDMFRNGNPAVYGGELCSRMLGYNGLMRDGINPELAFLGYRCAMALVAIKFFDNPFATVARDSDFDADPYKIGYLAVGQYLYAVTDWIIKKAKRDHREKIHFVARDGYLPMEAYHIFKQYDPDLPEDNYLYISRKALALTDIYQNLDMYSFWNKFAVLNYSPYKFDKIMKPYYREGISSLQEEMGVSDAIFKKHFENRTQYDRAIHALAACVDYDKLEEYKKELKTYFSEQIGKNDLMFDIGYSGRGEAALTRLLGYPVNSLYIHSNSQTLPDRERRYQFKTDCFYDIKPCITGIIREHVFMKLAPSTVGYQKENGKLMPEFEKYKVNAPTRMMTETVQNAALDFVRDMCSAFEGYTDMLTYRKDDLAFSFEYYLHYAKPIDRKVFGCVIFEDELGLGKAVSALDFWNQDIESFQLERLFSTESIGGLTSVDNFRSTLMPYSFRATCRQIFKLVKDWTRAKFFLRKYINLLKKSAYFDADWYLKTYLDVRASGIDPIRHYLLYGWKEMRDPSVDFSTRRYLECNPDVLAHGICPLLHYEQNGKYEQRKF